MMSPLSTSLQVASHDAWLAEMRKEPSEEVGRVVRPGIRQRLKLRVGQWLVSTGTRLQARTRQEESVTAGAIPSASAS